MLGGEKAMTMLTRDRWSVAAAPADPYDQLVYLSNLIGQDVALVQPGGGNTSLKTEETDFLGRPAAALVVKGSGTDLRTITRAGFTHLDRDRLLALSRYDELSDEAMTAACRQAMLFPDRDPLPSVETLLHAILPARYVAHTHDVATMSLTDTPHPERHIRAVWGESAAVVDYVRPGFPLARQIARLAIGPGVRGLALIKHGLVAWGETAEECYRTLLDLIARADAYLRPRPLRGAAPRPDLLALLPAIRGELCRRERVVLHLDDSPETVARISDPRFPELAARGVATPEHILRAGRLPAIVRAAEDVPAIPTGPVPDAVKIVAVPGGGLIGAGYSQSGARTAVTCYRTVLAVMENAEGIERFEFLDEARAVEMELWPLERRKIEARARKPFEGRVAVVIGAGSGIGLATARRFAEAGAHVVAADLQPPETGALPAAVDVRDEASLAALYEATVRAFGGLDILFYTPGVTPHLHGVEAMPLAEIERQLQVHYIGAVAATRLAAQVLIRQGIGGRLIYNVSKAAFAPGRQAAAYGASKAALAHYVRNVASELGRYQITANYVNADMIDTPLFRRLVAERAGQEGRSEAQVLARYRERSLTGDVLIPAEAVADAVLWLASDQAAYTTGCVITVGGGAEAFPR
jgi:rhamnose utilization protein RhaD (predicted bifunctional aldolase and dehydrogenase)/NAD(P)-dependent dehydrogenase (short-subunit alcohol dehydrogenase family)